MWRQPPGASAGIAVGLALLVIAAGGALTAGGQATARAGGPFELVSIPALGTVTWACGPEANRFGLGLRVDPPRTTTDVALYAEGRIRRRARITDRPLRLRLLPARRQALVLRQFSGAGTLTGTVAVDFGAGRVAAPCLPHLPPRTVVRMGPRA
jgi:hypothetical protein